MTNTEFITWLRAEIKGRGWSQAELARQTKLSPAQITRLFNGERGVGETALTAIAHALRMPADLVFEKAGFLPPKPELSQSKRTLIHLAQDLPDSDIELAIRVLQARVDYYAKNPNAKQEK